MVILIYKLRAFWILHRHHILLNVSVNLMFCFVHLLTRVWLLITSSCYPKNKKNLRTVKFIIKRYLLRVPRGKLSIFYYCNIGSI